MVASRRLPSFGELHAEVTADGDAALIAKKVADEDAKSHDPWLLTPRPMAELNSLPPRPMAELNSPNPDSASFACPPCATPDWAPTLESPPSANYVQLAAPRRNSFVEERPQFANFGTLAAPSAGFIEPRRPSFIEDAPRCSSFIKERGPSPPPAALLPSANFVPSSMGTFDEPPNVDLRGPGSAFITRSPAGSQPCDMNAGPTGGSLPCGVNDGDLLLIRSRPRLPERITGTFSSAYSHLAVVLIDASIGRAQLALTALNRVKCADVTGTVRVGSMLCYLNEYRPLVRSADARRLRQALNPAESAYIREAIIRQLTDAAAARRNPTGLSSPSDSDSGLSMRFLCAL
jgi:hypothetical protein